MDPLGFAVIADRIADSYARTVRARMRRVRFLTSIAIGGTFMWDLGSIEPAVKGDTPDIAFERVVIESLARSSQSGVELDTGIPGITKAQAALISRSRLDARGYLKSPRVFGFSGVYRPLAQATLVTDKWAGTLDAGRELIAALESDTGLKGIIDGRAGSPGSDFMSWLTQESGNSLRMGRNGFGTKNPNVQTLASIAAPQGAGPAEKATLARILNTPQASLNPEDDSVYLELLQILQADIESESSEWELVHSLAAAGSDSLRARMRMLLAFEDFARNLLWAFDTYRYIASNSVNYVPLQAVVTSNDALITVASSVKGLYETALSHMFTAVEHGVDPSLPQAFADRFAAFGEVRSVEELIESIMVHHDFVQKNKAPNGKRPWLELQPEGYAVRPLFTVDQVPELNARFIHPYRINTLIDFLADIYG